MVDSKSLLLTFLRESEEEEIINQLCGLSEDQWEALLATARQHKLGPILFYSLKPYYSSPHIPTHYQERMRNEYFNSATRNMRLYQQLEEVIKKFAKKDIPVILLKGAHLAKYIYGNIALRPMQDIDLLIKDTDLGQVHHLLIEDGYSTKDNIFEEELPPYEKKGKVALEIHSHLKAIPNKEYVDINTLWTRAEKVTLGEAKTLTLCPEDLFLHLCLHNCIQHRFENGLVACIDTLYFLKHFDGKLNWDKLWTRAQEWQIERAVYLMLALTEKMIGLQMSEQISQAVKPDKAAMDALTEAEELIFLQQPFVGRNLALLFGQLDFWRKFNVFLNRILLPKEIVKSDKKHLFYWSRLRSLYNSHRKIVWLGLRGNPETIKAIETQNRRSRLREWLTHAEEP